MKTQDSTEEKAEENKISVEEKSIEESNIKESDSNAQSRRKRIRSSDTVNDFLSFSPPSNTKAKARQISSSSNTESPTFLKKGGGYKMSMKPVENEEEKVESNDDEYFGCFNKNKKVEKGRARQRSMIQYEENIPNKDLSKTNPKTIQKIKYSIHSIIEEDSKSSSSASSVKSSDDLTFRFTSKEKTLRKHSSF